MRRPCTDRYKHGERSMLVFITVDAGVYIDRYEHGERSV